MTLSNTCVQPWPHGAGVAFISPAPHAHHPDGASAIGKLHHLCMKGVSFKRGQTDVLRDISLDFEEGSITAIVGPSGVGKSTLLNLLNGLLAPATGAIHCKGIGALQGAGPLRSHRQRASTIFQEHALIERLSALDNVLLGLADQRHPLSPWPWPQAMRERAAKALADVGLLGQANQRVAHLSGGQKQRVGMARALVREPRLLLGDEPFSCVDPALVQHLSNGLRQLVRQQGITAVLVLHQIDIARHLADRIVGLHGGRVVFDGPADSFDANAASAIFSAPVVHA